MSPIFDMDDRPLTEAEKADLLKAGKERLALWIKRSIYSAVALLLSCSLVVPFSDGYFLHDYAEPFGRLLVYLSMGMLLLVVGCAGIAINSWIYMREIKKDGM